MTWEAPTAQSVENKFPFPRWVSAGARPAHFYLARRESSLALCGVPFLRNAIDINPAVQRPHCKACTRLVAEDGTL